MSDLITSSVIFYNNVTYIINHGVVGLESIRFASTPSIIEVTVYRLWRARILKQNDVSLQGKTRVTSDLSLENSEESRLLISHPEDDDDDFPDDKACQESNVCWYDGGRYQRLLVSLLLVMISSKNIMFLEILPSFILNRENIFTKFLRIN